MGSKIKAVICTIGIFLCTGCSPQLLPRYRSGAERPTAGLELTHPPSRPRQALGLDAPYFYVWEVEVLCSQHQPYWRITAPEGVRVPANKEFIIEIPIVPKGFIETMPMQSLPPCDAGMADWTVENEFGTVFRTLTPVDLRKLEAAAVTED